LATGPQKRCIRLQSVTFCGFVTGGGWPPVLVSILGSFGRFMLGSLAAHDSWSDLYLSCKWANSSKRGAPF
jgi:hypothetical protein